MGIESSAKKRIIGVILLIIIFGVVVSIIVYIIKPWRQKKLEKETGTVSQYKEERKIRADSFSGYCILRSKERQNILATDGIRLLIEDDKANYIERIKALRDGEVDMAVFTVDSLLKACVVIGEFPATIVMVIDETKGADAIVAYKSAVGSINDLNRSDARFLLTPDSPSEFLARMLNADFSLPNLPTRWIEEADGAEDVYKRLMKASKTEPKAYVLWEPWLSRALKNPDVHVLIGSNEFKGYIVDVLVVRRDVLKEHPELVKSVVKSYLRAAYVYKDNMVDLIMEDSKLTGERISKEEAENIAKGIQWKNTLENYAHFGLLERQEARGLENLEDIITKITNVLVVTGAITKEQSLSIKPTTLFHKDILAALQAENFHPGQKLGIAQTGAKLDEIRGDIELLELTDEQWNSLIPVGQMRINPISFRTATAELSIQSKRDLEDLVTRLKSMPRYYLLVVGHARAEGDIDANKALAEGRAKAAAEYLVLRIGISRNRIRAIPAAPSGKGGEAQSVTFQLGQRPY